MSPIWRLTCPDRATRSKTVSTIILYMAFQVFFPIFNSSPGEYLGISLVNTGTRTAKVTVSASSSIGAEGLGGQHRSASRRPARISDHRNLWPGQKTAKRFASYRFDRSGSSHLSRVGQGFGRRCNGRSLGGLEQNIVTPRCSRYHAYSSYAYRYACYARKSQSRLCASQS